MIATVRMCEGVSTDEIEVGSSAPPIFGNDGPAWDFPATSAGEIDLGPVRSFVDLLEDEGSVTLLTNATDGAGAHLSLMTEDLDRLQEEGSGILAWDSTGYLNVIEVAELDETRDVLCEGWF